MGSRMEQTVANGQLCIRLIALVSVIHINLNSNATSLMHTKSNRLEL